VRYIAAAMSPRPAAPPATTVGDPPSPDRRADAYAFAAATLVPLGAYLVTLHPGLPAGDSGELITAAWTGGVAHPPGYPLYVMLAGAWAHALPFMTPALALNLFSAIAMSAAAGVLALAVARLSGSRAAGVLSAWAFAFALPVWTCAIVAEVFALNALLAALTLLLLAHAGGSAPVRSRGGAPPAPSHPLTVPALILVTVLALSHHHTLLLLAIPASLVAFAAAWREQAGRHARLLGTSVAAKLLALLPLAWLPFAAQRRGALVWGDASGLRGFLSLLLRNDYGTFRLDPLDAGLHADRSHLLLWLESLPHAFGSLPLGLAVLGAFALAARHRRVALALTGYAALQALFFTRIGLPSQVAWLRGVVERFHILPDLVLALLAGLGLAWVLGRLPRPARPIMTGMALALAIAVPVLTLGRSVNQRGNRFAESLGEGMLASLPPRAVLFAQGDLQHNALAYVTRVRGLRPDVSVLDQELMTYPWYVKRVRERHPGLLPPLGRAQRIGLRDGRLVEGWSIPRRDGSVDVLTEGGQATMPAAEVVRVFPAAGESLFAGARARFRSGWLHDRSEDRYSGLPGTRTLLWLDHLAGVRPVALVGTKDDSWSLRYRLTPVGFVALATAPDAVPDVAAQAAAALRVFAAAPMDAYFRDQDPASFEAAERWRFAAVAARAALVLSQPQAAPAVRADPRGWERLCAFARRFETLEPSPDSACLRAIGFLRLFGPSFVDHALARRDLERYLASGDPGAAKDVEARATLARLTAESGQGPATP
jgi:hypothetical protein